MQVGVSYRSAAVDLFFLAKQRNPDAFKDVSKPVMDEMISSYERSFGAIITRKVREELARRRKLEEFERKTVGKSDEDVLAWLRKTIPNYSSFLATSLREANEEILVGPGR